MKRSIEWSILLLVALLAIGLVVFGVLDRSTGKQRDVAVEQVRARLLVELDEEPGTSPVAAAVPVMLATPSPVRPSGESDEALRSRWRDVFGRVEGIFYHEHDEDNRCAGDVVCAVNGGASVRELSEGDRALLAGFLANHDGLVNEIVALVNAGPDLLEWVCRGGRATGLSVLGGGVSGAYACCRLLALAACADVVAGDWARGAERAAAACALWAHLPLERRGYSSTLLDVAVADFLARAPREAMEGESGAMLAAFWPGRHDRGAFARKLAEKVRRDLEWVDGLPESRRMLRENGSDLPDVRMYRAAWLGYSTVCQPMLNRDVEFMAQSAERLIDVARLPYYESKPVVDEVMAEMQKQLFTAEFSNHSVWTMIYAFNIQAISEARRDTRAVGGLVEAFRDRHKRYPRSLDELAADSGEALPVDPMTGDSLLYRVADDGYTIYSVGLNGDDDGGEPGRYEEGDIIMHGQRRDDVSGGGDGEAVEQALQPGVVSGVE